MKKLLTIFCALSLIMAFSVPAMALDDIEDNQAGVALLGQNNQAQKGGEIDNDGLDVDTGDILSNNSQDNSNTNNTTTNTDSSNKDYSDNSNWQLDKSDNSNWQQTNTDASNHDNPVATDSFQSEDNDGTDVDVAFDDIKLEDIANDKSDDDVVDNKGGNMDNDLVDNDSHDNDNDLVDQDGDQDVVDQKYGDNDLADNDMNDNMAAAAMGGFAIGISIDDIELNLAQTTSYSGIVQTSAFGAAATELGLFNDDAEVKYEGSCNRINASVYENTGIQAANFTAGNFNNSANLNSVTMTVQY
jgi:hypothetical protein